MTQNQCLGRCAGSKTLLRLGHPEILQVDTVAVSFLLFRKGKISCSAVDQVIKTRLNNKTATITVSVFFSATEGATGEWAAWAALQQCPLAFARAATKLQ